MPGRVSERRPGLPPELGLQMERAGPGQDRAGELPPVRLRLASPVIRRPSAARSQQTWVVLHQAALRPMPPRQAGLSVCQRYWPGLARCHRARSQRLGRGT